MLILFSIYFLFIENELLVSNICHESKAKGSDKQNGKSVLLFCNFSEATLVY